LNSEVRRQWSIRLVLRPNGWPSNRFLSPFRLTVLSGVGSRGAGSVHRAV
jgi:hypothetical protein